MNKQLFLPKQLAIAPSAPDADKGFKYWLRTVEDFIESLDLQLKIEGSSPEITMASTKPVVLNRGYTYPLGVRSTKLFLGYTPRK